MRLAKLERSIAVLAAEVRALHEAGAQRQLRTVLRRRGLLWRKALHEGSITPSGARATDEFYQLMRHYSFRLFLRDVIQHRERLRLADLVRYCSPATARRYLRWLLDHGLVRRRGRWYALTVDAVSFGPTLEWFVATVLEREYGIASAWNVRLAGARGGGDYDVVGFEEGTIIYIETKSAPPRSIDLVHVRAFCDRVEHLRPHIAIFLNDTQLRMRDKIAPLFDDELQRRRPRRRATHTLQPLAAETFRVGDQLFITNSAPDLVANVGICLAHYFRRGGMGLNGAR